ncbi:17717_t:CDS:2 [Cetraspora pellucida]|uniref:17717_t:CDS:1 n=1 Tax=Cetraspora pellucida TaxID=1433469 RepID=A0A9N9DHW4_9GLOM|nr:17717_t:CDS:2 [Cetraspora pellucida]
MVDFNEQKLVIRYLARRFEVPIMHTDKEKQKDYVNKNMRSNDHDSNKNDNNNLFEKFEYENEDLEEKVSQKKIDDENIEKESLAVSLAVIKEVSTKKKLPVDEKPLVKDQLNLFANGLEKLEQTNLVKHMIKTSDID